MNLRDVSDRLTALAELVQRLTKLIVATRQTGLGTIITMNYGTMKDCHVEIPILGITQSAKIAMTAEDFNMYGYPVAGDLVFLSYGHEGTNIVVTGYADTNKTIVKKAGDKDTVDRVASTIGQWQQNLT